MGFLKIQRTGWTAILRERGLSPQSFCWLPWEENSGRVYGKSSVRSPMDTTYGDIAKKIAEKMNRETMSAQAVGGAVGHNPISIIIPCHRVVGAAGSLTGYAGGIDKKIWLLKHEGVDMEGLFIPEKGTAL